MKKWITQFLVFSLVIQSLGQGLLFADAYALDFNPFVAEISLAENENAQDYQDPDSDGGDAITDACTELGLSEAQQTLVMRPIVSHPSTNELSALKSPGHLGSALQHGLPAGHWVTKVE